MDAFFNNHEKNKITISQRSCPSICNRLMELASYTYTKRCPFLNVIPNRRNQDKKDDNQLENISNEKKHGKKTIIIEMKIKKLSKFITIKTPK